ncbi:MAG: hypothetical protein OXD33_05700 [Rhodobacteraceae bacterium]|nr:hypothetical protein [Paracoccaceae bacterium]
MTFCHDRAAWYAALKILRDDYGIDRPVRLIYWLCQAAWRDLSHSIEPNEVVVADKDPLKVNWEEFERLQKTVKAEDIGRTALLHDGKLVAIFNDSGDTYQIGVEKFGAGNFSIQTFGEMPKSLGFLATHGPMFGNAA